MPSRKEKQLSELFFPISLSIYVCLLSHWIFASVQDRSDQTSQAICPYISKLNVIFCYTPGLFHIMIYLWAEIIYICIKKCRNLLSLRFVRGGEDVFHDLWWARFSSIEHSSMHASHSNFLVTTVLHVLYEAMLITEQKMDPQSVS